jgi:hypothetical protein
MLKETRRRNSPNSAELDLLNVEPEVGRVGKFEPPRHRYIEMEKFDSAYFKDHNEEDYALKRAFNCNNFTYLR